MSYGEALATFFAAGVAIVLFVLLIALAVAIVVLIGEWKLYKKAGKGGWEAIVPFYNTYVLVEIAGLKWYWFLFLMGSIIASILGSIIPALDGILGILGTIAVILGYVSVFYNLGKKLHKSTGWVVLGVIFSGIVLAIEGYKKENCYDRNVVVPENGPFDSMFKGNTNNQGTPVNNVNPNVTNEQQAMPTNGNVAEPTNNSDNNQNVGN